MCKSVAHILHLWMISCYCNKCHSGQFFSFASPLFKKANCSKSIIRSEYKKKEPRLFSTSRTWILLVGQTEAITEEIKKERNKERKRKRPRLKYLFSENLLCEDCLHSAEWAGFNNNLKQRTVILSSSFLIKKYCKFNL